MSDLAPHLNEELQAYALAAWFNNLPTFEIALEEKVEQLIEEKLKTKDVQNGENLNVEEISEIYREANMIVREKMNLKLNTRGKTGEVEDYLEIRRPLHQGKQI